MELWVLRENSIWQLFLANDLLTPFHSLPFWNYQLLMNSWSHSNMNANETRNYLNILFLFFFFSQIIITNWYRLIFWIFYLYFKLNQKFKSPWFFSILTFWKKNSYSFQHILYLGLCSFLVHFDGESFLNSWHYFLSFLAKWLEYALLLSAISILHL